MTAPTPTPTGTWTFTDDRGQLSSAPRRPTRVVAYIQAGATLLDHGIRPLGIFGSYHDGDAPDRAKSGLLALDEVAYFGAGETLDPERLLAAAPDLVVAVSYGGNLAYGIAPEAAKHLEEQVPLVVLDVGQGRSLDEVRERFAALAASLGGMEDPAAEAALDAARGRLRAASALPDPPGVLALSAAGADQVHLARPHAWPDLRALAALGVNLLDRPPGGGASWSTTGWSEAVALAPRIVLADGRANAVPVDPARFGDARVIPWNPELPASRAAHARFFDAVARALAP
ncbi:ABC transporter substrate-binding protein [Streptomyces sp. H27-C3]|uniref:ABC transporter substrate-binding protein n=1 Tax=Streptomyces sp. H27-C3 TaxID=3046305 RepID=UPI0024BAC0B2|nr:ABC transporter substrate-binding protein [Streptomyces sp. H27-C3]MDJ0460992.1 ABC transporter substrate-binding protein [Streptomyces sp. H27-C3]